MPNGFEKAYFIDFSQSSVRVADYFSYIWHSVLSRIDVTMVEYGLSLYMIHIFIGQSLSLEQIENVIEIILKCE